MNSTFLFIYTALLFIAVIYLFYLQRYHFPKYVDQITKVSVNLNLFLLLFFFTAFLISLCLSLLFYSFESVGALVGQVIVKEVDCNQISKLNKPENWVIVDKNIAIPKDQLKYLKKDQIVQPSFVEVSEEKQVSNTSPSKQNPTPFSPNEKNEKSFIARGVTKLYEMAPESVAGGMKKLYEIAPESIQQKVVDAGANELVKTVKKGNLTQEDQGMVVDIINQFKDNRTRVPPSEVGVHINENVEATHFRCRTENEKGEEIVFDCVHPIRILEIYNEKVEKETGTPVMPPSEMSLIKECANAVGMDKVVCAPVEKEKALLDWNQTTTPNAPVDSNLESSEYEAQSPSKSTHNQWTN